MEEKRQEKLREKEKEKKQVKKKEPLGDINDLEIDTGFEINELNFYMDKVITIIQILFSFPQNRSHIFYFQPLKSQEYSVKQDHLNLFEYFPG